MFDRIDIRNEANLKSESQETRWAPRVTHHLTNQRTPLARSWIIPGLQPIRRRERCS